MSPKTNVNQPFLANLLRMFAAVMLVWALAGHGYGYYVLLRWVVCAVAAWTALESHTATRTGMTWLFSVAALLFNPFVPVRLDRQTWMGPDIVLAVAFVLASLPHAKHTKTTSAS